ncbi:MAG: hypothetical protein MJ117_06545 [Lachnospiraceae bacterium]|nr:hypothetical protein [Lachnospiraceae bacterium]
MKKIYVVVLMSVMAVSLAACGKSAETGASSVQEEGAETTADAETKETEAADDETTGASGYAAFSGMWYNVDTSLAEIILSEGSVSFRGDEYEIADVVVPEGEDVPDYTLFTAKMEDGNSLQLDLLDAAKSGEECDTIHLYQIDRDTQDEGIELGVFVNDIQYTHGDPEMFANLDVPAEGEETDGTGGAPSVSEGAAFYLLDHVELEDGSKQSAKDFSNQEFALVYEETSPCMTGMMFSSSVANLYRIGSDSDGLQLEVEVTGDDGKSELMWLPMSFNQKDNTMTLDFSKTGLKIKSMVFKQTDDKEFFSGNREAIASMY